MSPELTPHQLHVLRMVAEGRTHAQIAAELVVTPKGATAAVNRVLAKLGAANAPHAVLLACQAGILDGRPQRHGDHAGYEAHRRRGEKPCEPCRAGERAYRNKPTQPHSDKQEAA
ncbi:LuxR C-terminal-related transcriptional regulator [Streptomyces sp. NPDC053493]|uniref:LuxR C-terminal-related transcriptional regulator n=1 Tax=Streptomyces sp. NPDC053493 TaxID=3365705 RepID=UPI0037CE8EA2